MNARNLIRRFLSTSMMTHCPPGFVDEKSRASDIVHTLQNRTAAQGKSTITHGPSRMDITRNSLLHGHQFALSTQTGNFLFDFWVGYCSLVGKK
jgi:hypothetical protein